MIAVFAANSLNGFGIGDTMPWPRSDLDMARFKRLTDGGVVVMGKTTWLSDMPRPLPNRRNCVLSTTLVDHRCEVYPNITALITDVGIGDNVFVIGGAKVLWGLRPQINKIYFTRHRGRERSDVTIDTQRYFDGFALTEQEEMTDLTFETYNRK